LTRSPTISLVSRVLIAVFLSALVILFLLLSVLPALVEYGERGTGPFVPDARLDSSQVRIIEPDTLSFTVGLTLDYIEVVTRHRAAHEARPSGWLGID